MANYIFASGIKALDPNDLSVKLSSDRTCSGRVRIKDDYIYSMYGGKISKFNLDDLTFVSQSDVYVVGKDRYYWNNVAWDINGDYAYALTTNTPKVAPSGFQGGSHIAKIRLSDMAFIASGVTMGIVKSQVLTSFGNYVYAGGSLNVERYNTSDLSYVNKSSNTWALESMNVMTNDNTYIYLTDNWVNNPGFRVTSTLGSRMAYTQIAGSYVGNGLCYSNTFLYITDTQGYIGKYTKTSGGAPLTTINATAGKGLYAEATETYLYNGRGNYVEKRNVSDLSLVSTSANLGVVVDDIIGGAITLAPPTNLHFRSGSTTMTSVGIAWTNNCTVGDYNMIQYKDLTYGTNHGQWIDAGHVTIFTTGFTITHLIPTASYEIRVVLVGSWYPSESIFTTLPDGPTRFCTEPHYSISASTCGNSNGSINITDLDYLLFYSFALTDVDGNSYSITTGGTFTGLRSNYYFLTATVDPFYQVIFGVDRCHFDWLELNDSNTSMALTGTTVTPVQCGPFDVQFGRIFYRLSGFNSGHTYTFKAFTDDLLLYKSQTGITNAHDLIIQNSPAQCYWVVITDNTTNCHLLIPAECVPSVPIYSLGGCKKLWIAPWSTDLDYNFWSTKDSDYFLEFLDTSFFMSTKIKEYLSASGGTGCTWYEIPVLPKAVSLGQKLSKVRQGYIFEDTLNFAVAKANATKWTEIAKIINPENKWIYVLQDDNDFYWTGGYRHGSRITAYSFKTGARGEDNGYNLQITAISENKILTNIDENYVIQHII